MSNVISITNGNLESAYPWKMPLRIFTSDKVLPSAANSTFEFFTASLMKVITLLFILCIFTQVWRDNIIGFFVVIHTLATFYASLSSSRGCSYQGTVSHLFHPSARAGYDTRSIFKRSLTGFNSEFSFSKTSCLSKVEEPNLSYYLPIAGGRIIGFIPLPRVLVLCEMQSVRSRIWTRVAVSISREDNHYTTGIFSLLRDTINGKKKQEIELLPNLSG